MKGNDMPLEEALRSAFEKPVSIVRQDRVSGGDINEAYKLTLHDGSQVFLKTNKEEHLSFFTTEIAGLFAIARTGTVGTPKVLSHGIDKTRKCSYLLMEFIEGERRAADCWEIFARELAAMHRFQTTDLVPGGRYGFYQDNYIGAGKQKNKAHDSWISFFRDCRLKPQYEVAEHYFKEPERRQLRWLMEHLSDYLVEPAYPSLLHGDLWSGNVILGNDGKLWLIDPAAYVGHAEADLAMTELFGGFPRVFYETYKKAAPMQPGYERRRDLYNLYHLLNHLNLFGSTYLPSVLRILREYAPY